MEHMERPRASTKIAEAWADFEQRVVHPEAPPEQRNEMRRTFYLGAWCMYCEIIKLGETEERTDDEQVLALESLHQECLGFGRDVQEARK